MTVADRFKRSVQRAQVRAGGSIVYKSKTILVAVSALSESREVDSEMDLLPRRIEIVGEVSNFTDGVPAMAEVVSVTHIDNGISAVKYSVQERETAQGVIVMVCERVKK